MDCAEQLFAERGVEGVSLRGINAQAGLSPAALHYHFRTKQALVDALLERRMPALMERRREILDALESAAEPPSARDVLEALVRPLAELLAREGERGQRYVRLIARLRSDDDIDRQKVIARYAAGVERLEPLLQRALPEQPAIAVRLRLVLAIDTLLRGLADWQTLAAAARTRGAPASLDHVVGELLEFLAAGLDAPPHVTLARLGSESGSAIDPHSGCGPLGDEA